MIGTVDLRKTLTLWGGEQRFVTNRACRVITQGGPAQGDVVLDCYPAGEARWRLPQRPG